jgi:hypothetical protein
MYWESNVDFGTGLDLQSKLMLGLEVKVEDKTLERGDFVALKAAALTFIKTKPLSRNVTLKGLFHLT